ncbi:LysR family transcriptional regulator [Cochlodiniinecator piscidefendens]|uniref:LysR family transcriptional regulator n=1 Tax=Cochlodiniinecator piscidefendens TaxID=2715756 RepID=UPI00140A442E|nr:LysR family transcriptional regulator [Cochlodiniinecator piscidefendens]
MAQPPLNALRTFEVAARCGSFVQAGQELGVSSAAISLQIKNLEGFLGKELFLRQGNRIFLTDAGEAIYPNVAQALQQLTQTTQSLQFTKARAQLVISALPSLADLLLLPNITEHPELDGVTLDIRVEDDPVNFANSDIDLRLTYGTKFYQDFHQTNLFYDTVIPVCIPQFWAQFGNKIGDLSKIPDRYFIHNRWGRQYGTEPTWAEWFDQHGKPPPSSSKARLIISSTSLAVRAARLGQGIALAPKQLVQADLDAGTLMTPAVGHLQMKRAYVAVSLHAKSTYKPLAGIVSRLKRL